MIFFHSRKKKRWREGICGESKVCYTLSMLKKIIIGIVLNGFALYGVIYILPEITYRGGILFFAVGGITMGILNTLVKPLLKLVTFPLHILTLGLSLIVINGLIFWIFDQVLDILSLPGISMSVPALKTYFFAGFIFGIINWVEHLMVSNG